MKIHLLVGKYYTAPEDNSPSVQLLMEAAQKKGHELIPITLKQCKMVFVGKPSVVVESKKRTRIKALLVRMAFSKQSSENFMTVLKQFELAGTKVMNSYDAITIARNKIRSHQLLQEKKMPTPHTFAVQSAEYIEDMMERIGKFPVIIKRALGAQGMGVAIVESKRALHSIIDMLGEDESNAPLIVQQYVREARGKDIRVFVIGHKVVAAMDRSTARRGEFRSNFSIGGKIKKVELTHEEKRLAIKASKAFDLDWGGIDIIRSNEGPKILEVNSNPGLKGITTASGVDVASKIIDYIVKQF